MQCSSCAVRASTCFAAWRSFETRTAGDGQKSRGLFERRALNWADAEAPLLGHTIRKFKPMLQRIETAQIEKMVDASKQPESSPQRQQQSQALGN